MFFLYFVDSLMLLQLGNFLLLNDVFILVYCRIEGGIPPLVELLESQDLKVQRAAAGALRTLAFKNDENKSQVRYQNFKITRPTL